MTDTTPAATPATPGSPDTPAAPTAAPAKKSPWRFLGPIIGVLVVLGGIVYTVVLPMIADNQFKVGACLDTFPATTGTTTVDPAVVDCSDAAAASKIIAVVEDKTLADAYDACPAEWIAAISFEASSPFGKNKLLCLVEA